MTVIAAEIHNVNIPNCIPNPNNNLFPGSPANNIEIDIICIVVWYWLDVHSTDAGVCLNLENATFAWVGRQDPTWPTTGPLENIDDDIR